MRPTIPPQQFEREVLFFFCHEHVALFHRLLPIIFGTEIAGKILEPNGPPAVGRLVMRKASSLDLFLKIRRSCLSRRLLVHRETGLWLGAEVEFLCGSHSHCELMHRKIRLEAAFCRQACLSWLL